MAVPAEPSKQCLHDVWRTRLCKHGIYCGFADCSFAHRLCDSRAPNERNTHYDQAWKDGVDRWFGQPMTTAQVEMIQYYLRHTPLRDAPPPPPPWVAGLRYAIDAKPLEQNRYLQWDYGLTMDLELLCHHRRGHVLFQFMPHLWTVLVQPRVLSIG